VKEKRLNRSQLQSVRYGKGPLLIIAGAGTGKTTVITERIGYLIGAGLAKPESILALTFTDKAAMEMEERVDLAMPYGYTDMWIATFHSFCDRVLRQEGLQIGLDSDYKLMSGAETTQFLINHLFQFKLDYFRPRGNPTKFVAGLLQHFSRLRDEDVQPKEYLAYAKKRLEEAKTEEEKGEAVKTVELAEAYQDYQKLKIKEGVLDFADLIVNVLRLFRTRRNVLSQYRKQFKYILVDEFQDTNPVQMKLIMELVKGHKNITVVGDDDQSIYGWRGADVSNILGFPKKFDQCNVVRLQRNYRSTESILNVANHIIKKNANRHDKVLKAEAYDHKGDKPEIFIYETEEDESREMVQQVRYFERKGFSFKDVAILYRSNSQGAFLESELRHNQIPYNLTGGTAFFERREVKDVLAYLHCAFSPNEIAIRRVINTPSRGIGDKTIEALEELAQEKGVGFYELFQVMKKEELSPKLQGSVYEFRQSCTALKELLLNRDPVKSVGERLLDHLDDIKYRAFVFSNYKDSHTAQKRWKLLEIFSRVLDSFVAKSGETVVSVRSFIETMELRDQIEEQENEKDDKKVQLMTLHGCKGLEFPVVLMIGMEEEIIPHRTLGLDIDEERRLFYVGLTRAKQHLVLSRTRERKRFGSLKATAPSRFLLEIPPDLITEYEHGFRPLQEDERTSMLADLYKKLS